MTVVTTVVVDGFVDAVDGESWVLEGIMLADVLEPGSDLLAMGLADGKYRWHRNGCR